MSDSSLCSFDGTGTLKYVDRFDCFLLAFFLDDVDEFLAFLQDSGLNEYAGGFAPRNGFSGGWWTKIDLQLSQELPGFFDGHSSEAFIVVDNFTNMLNDEWGIMREASFPRRVSVVDASLSDDNSQFVYTNFSPESTANLVGDASLWTVRIGVKYKF